MAEGGSFVILNHIVEELLDSSGSSDEEWADFMFVVNHREAGEDMVVLPRTRDYVENIVPQFSPQMFKQHFRLDPVTFEHVLGRISPTITNISIDNRGRPTVLPHKQFLITLWYLATPDSYRSLCDRFNIGKATAIRTVRRVCAAIFNLAPEEIKWPTGNRLVEVVNGFQAKNGFPSVIGVVDGTHVNIPKPHVNGDAYVNRKGVPSIILQGVCDHEARFTHCYAGQVGSVHDARVLRLSKVQEYIDNEGLNRFPHNTHLLGDPAYPCSKHLMVAFKNNGHLTNRQKNYNFCLSSTRTVIERAFGFLKGRFRCLKFLDMTRVDKIPELIVACCVLHNICMTMNDEPQEDINIVEEEEDDEEYVPEGVFRQNGNLKRLEIVDLLPNRLLP